MNAAQALLARILAPALSAEPFPLIEAPKRRRHRLNHESRCRRELVGAKGLRP